MANIEKDSFMQKLVFGMLGFLVVQFVLGMVMNLYGVPLDDPAYATESIFIKLSGFAHGIIGILLVAGAISALFFALKKGNSQWGKVSIYGLISILIAAGGGIAAIMLKDSASELALSLCL